MHHNIFSNPVGFFGHALVTGILAVPVGIVVGMALGAVTGIGGQFAGAIQFLAIAALLAFATKFRRGAENFIPSLITVFAVLGVLGIVSAFVPMLSFGFEWTLSGVALGFSVLYLAEALADKVPIKL